MLFIFKFFLFFVGFFISWFFFYREIKFWYARLQGSFWYAKLGFERAYGGEEVLSEGLVAPGSLVKDPQ